MYKRIIVVVALGLLATCVGAAFPQTPTKAPEVPASLVTKTFKAQAELAQAQLQAKAVQETVNAKTQAMQQVLAELTSACGKDFQPQLNGSGDPVCVAKPAAKGAKTDGK